MINLLFFFFFFSSRRRHTRLTCDWSSDVCSSDLPTEIARHEVDRGEHLLMEPLNASTGFYIKATRQIGEWQTRFQRMQIYETPHYGKLFFFFNDTTTTEK